MKFISGWGLGMYLVSKAAKLSIDVILIQCILRWYFANLLLSAVNK